MSWLRRPTQPLVRPYPIDSGLRNKASDIAQPASPSAPNPTAEPTKNDQSVLRPLTKPAARTSGSDNPISPDTFPDVRQR